jgi:hypothetical protein
MKQTPIEFRLEPSAILEERLVRIEKAIFAITYLLRPRTGPGDPPEWVDQLAGDLLDLFQTYMHEREEYWKAQKEREK